MVKWTKVCLATVKPLVAQVKKFVRMANTPVVPHNNPSLKLAMVWTTIVTAKSTMARICVSQTNSASLVHVWAKKSHQTVRTTLVKSLWVTVARM